MLYLVTGQPGTGKTSLGLDRAFKLQKEGRTIYAHGIKDLDYERAGFLRFPDDDPTRWQELPDGSVCLIDECYSAFPNRNPGSKVPEHVEPMARHRHRGFDFILLAQQGLQLDPFLRGLYESHEHLKIKYGNVVELRRWGSYQGNVNGLCSDKSTFVRPKYVFDFYTSTVLDTTKKRIPSWLKWVAIGIVVCVAVLGYLKYSTTKKMETMRSQHVAAGDVPSAALARSPAADPSAPRYDTPQDYAVAHLPRFGTMPWTAPVYDSRTITADPQLICASSLAGQGADGSHLEASCTCLTEQSTVYEVSEPECRRIARQGPVYNPYKQTQHAQVSAQPVQHLPPPAGVPTTASLSSPQINGYGDIGIQLKPGT